MIEAIFEILFEFFGELILQMFFEVLAEFGLRLFRREGSPAQGSVVLRIAGYALLGALCGGISLWLVPHSLLHTANGRVANLILAPVAAGVAMGAIGAWRRGRGQDAMALDRFGYGYVFALAMAGVRFVGAA